MRYSSIAYLILTILLFMVLLPPATAYSGDATALYNQGVALITSKNYTEAGTGI